MKLDNLGHAWSNVQQNKQRLNLKSNSSFIYFHSPQNWNLEYIEIDKKTKPVLLPEFSVLRFTSGINLIRENGKTINSSIAIANLKENGNTIIDPQKYDYIRVYPCKKGNRYEDAFTTFEQLGNSIITNYDMKSFNQFRCMLMRDETISIPHEHFIKIMIQDNQKLINKYSQLQHNPNHEALYKKAIQKDKDLKQAKQALKKLGSKAYESK